MIWERQNPINKQWKLSHIMLTSEIGMLVVEYLLDSDDVGLNTE